MKKVRCYKVDSTQAPEDIRWMFNLGKGFYLRPVSSWEGKSREHPYAAFVTSSEIVDVDQLQAGDRCSVEKCVGTYQDDDGISHGGVWVRKEGIVETAFEDGDVFIQFDDGDIQITSGLCGQVGYPARNAVYMRS